MHTWVFEGDEALNYRTILLLRTYRTSCLWRVFLGITYDFAVTQEGTLKVVSSMYRDVPVRPYRMYDRECPSINRPFVRLMIDD